MTDEPAAIRWALTLALPLCAACSGFAVTTSASTHAYDPFGRLPLSSAQVCVFRPASIDAAITTPVRDNGVAVGATQGPSYFCYMAGPGEHRITVEMSTAAPLFLRVEAGERYFVEQQMEAAADRLVLVDRARAEKLVEVCDYATVVEAPQGEPLPLPIPLVAGLPTLP